MIMDGHDFFAVALYDQILDIWLYLPSVLLPSSIFLRRVCGVKEEKHDHVVDHLDTTAVQK